MFSRNNGGFVSPTQPSQRCSNFSAPVWTHTHQSPVCASKSPEQVILRLFACAQGIWFEFKSVPGVYLFSFLNTCSYQLFRISKLLRKSAKGHCSHFASNFSFHRKCDMSSEKEFKQHESKANTRILEKVYIFLHLTGPLLPRIVSSSNKSGWISLMLEQDIGQYGGIF